MIVGKAASYSEKAPRRRKRKHCSDVVSPTWQAWGGGGFGGFVARGTVGATAGEFDPLAYDTLKVWLDSTRSENTTVGGPANTKFVITGRNFAPSAGNFSPVGNLGPMVDVATNAAHFKYQRCLRSNEVASAWNWLQDSTTDWLAVFYFRRTENTGSTVFSTCSFNSTNTGINLRTVSLGRIQIGTFDGSTGPSVTTGSNTLEEGAETTIAIEKTGTTIRIYIGGVLRGTLSVTNANSGTPVFPFQIGNHFSNGSADFWLPEFLLFTKAVGSQLPSRTAAERYLKKRWNLASAVVPFPPSWYLRGKVKPGTTGLATTLQSTFAHSIVSSDQNLGNLGGNSQQTTNGFRPAWDSTNEATIFRDGRHLQASIAASNFNDFHNAAGEVLASFVFRVVQLGQVHTLLRTSDPSNLTGTNGITLRIDSSDRVNCQVGNSSGVVALNINTANNSITTGVHVVTFLKVGADVQIYINGTLQASGTIASPNNGNAAQAPTFGSRRGSPAPTDGMDGWMPEVAIWFGAEQPTRANVEAAMAAEFAGMASWVVPLNIPVASAYYVVSADTYLSIGGTTTLTDLSGWGNHATEANANAPTFVASWRNGRSALAGATGRRLSRANFVQGAIDQPCTYYVVGRWGTSNTGANKFWFDGRASRQSIYARGTGSISAPALFAGTQADLGVNAAFSTDSIARGIFNGATSHLRVEPHNSTVRQGTLSPSSNQMNGITIMADNTDGREWTGGHLAFLVMLPIAVTPGSTLDTAIMNSLRAEYNITHT